MYGIGNGDHKLNSFNSLVSLVNSRRIKDRIGDSWKWRESTNDSYTTKEAYNLLHIIRFPSQANEWRRRPTN